MALRKSKLTIEVDARTEGTSKKIVNLEKDLSGLKRTTMNTSKASQEAIAKMEAKYGDLANTANKAKGVHQVLHVNQAGMVKTRKNINAIAMEVTHLDQQAKTASESMGLLTKASEGIDVMGKTAVKTSRAFNAFTETFGKVVEIVSFIGNPIMMGRVTRLLRLLASFAALKGLSPVIVESIHDTARGLDAMSASVSIATGNFFLMRSSLPFLIDSMFVFDAVIKGVTNSAEGLFLFALLTGFATSHAAAIGSVAIIYRNLIEAVERTSAVFVRYSKGLFNVGKVIQKISETTIVFTGNLIRFSGTVLGVSARLVKNINILNRYRVVQDLVTKSIAGGARSFTNLLPTLGAIQSGFLSLKAVALEFGKGFMAASNTIVSITTGSLLGVLDGLTATMLSLPVATLKAVQSFAKFKSILGPVDAARVSTKAFTNTYKELGELFVKIGARNVVNARKEIMLLSQTIKASRGAFLGATTAITLFGTTGATAAQALASSFGLVPAILAGINDFNSLLIASQAEVEAFGRISLKVLKAMGPEFAAIPIMFLKIPESLKLASTSVKKFASESKPSIDQIFRTIQIQSQNTIEAVKQLPSLLAKIPDGLAAAGSGIQSFASAAIPIIGNLFNLVLDGSEKAFMALSRLPSLFKEMPTTISKGTSEPLQKATQTAKQFADTVKSTEVGQEFVKTGQDFKKGFFSPFSTGMKLMNQSIENMSKSNIGFLRSMGTTGKVLKELGIRAKDVGGVFLHTFKPGILSAIELTTALAPLLVSLSQRMKESEDATVRFAGHLLFFASTALAGVGVAIRAVLGGLGEKFVSMGKKLIGFFEASDEAVKKSEINTKKFAFVVKNVAETMGRDANKELEKYNNLLNKITANSAIAGSEARKGIEFIAKESVAMNKSFKKVEALVIRAKDLSAATGKGFKDVLTAMVSGIGGVSQGLFNMGINIKESALQQLELSETFGMSFSKLSDVQKQQVRYNQILERSKFLVGAAAVEMDTMAGSQLRVASAVNDMKLAFSELNFFTEAFVIGMNNLKETIITELPEPIVLLIGTFADLTGVLLTLFGTFLKILIPLSAISFALSIADAAVFRFGAQMTKTGTIANKMTNALIFLANRNGVAVKSIHSIGDAMEVLVRTGFAGFKNAITGAINGIKALPFVIAKAIKWLVAARLVLLKYAAIAALILGVAQAFQELTEDVKKTTFAVEAFGLAGKKASEGGNFLGEMLEFLGEMAARVWNSFKELLKLILSTGLFAMTALGGAVATLITVFDALINGNSGLKRARETFKRVEGALEENLQLMKKYGAGTVTALTTSSKAIKRNEKDVQNLIKTNRLLASSIKDIKKQDIKISILGDDFGKKVREIEVANREVKKLKEQIAKGILPADIKDGGAKKLAELQENAQRKLFEKELLFRSKNASALDETRRLVVENLRSQGQLVKAAKLEQKIKMQNLKLQIAAAREAGAEAESRTFGLRKQLRELEKQTKIIVKNAEVEENDKARQQAKETYQKQAQALQKKLDLSSKILDLEIRQKEIMAEIAPTVANEVNLIRAKTALELKSLENTRREMIANGGNAEAINEQVKNLQELIKLQNNRKVEKIESGGITEGQFDIINKVSELQEKLINLKKQEIELSGKQKDTLENQQSIIFMNAFLEKNRLTILQKELELENGKNKILDERFVKMKKLVDARAKEQADELAEQMDATTLGDVFSAVQKGFSKDFWMDFGKGAKKGVMPLVNSFKGGFGGVMKDGGKLLSFAWDEGKDLFEKGKEALSNIKLEDIGSFMMEAFEVGADLFVEGVGAVASFFNPDMFRGFGESMQKLTTMPLEMEGAMTSMLVGMDQISVNFASNMEKFISKFPELLQGFLQRLPEFITGLLQGLSKILDFLPQLIEGLAAALPTIISGIADALVLIFNKLPDILQSVFAQLPKILESILKALPRVILALLDAIPKIAIALVEAVPDIVISLVENIGPVIEALVEGLVVGAVDMAVGFIDALFFKGGIEKIVGALLRAVPKIILAILNGLLRAIKRLFGKFFGGEQFSVQANIDTKKLEKDIDNVFKKTVTKNVTKATEDLFKVVDINRRSRDDRPSQPPIVQVVTNVTGGQGGAGGAGGQGGAGGMFDGFGELLGGLFNDLKVGLEGLTSGQMVRTIENNFSNIDTKVGDNLKGLEMGLIQAWQGAWGFLERAFGPTIKKTEKGLLTEWRNGVESAQGLWDRLDSSWKDEWSELEEWCTVLWGKLDNSWKDEWQNLSDWATALWDKLDRSWKEEWGNLWSWIETLWDLLANGKWAEAWDHLTGWIGDLWTKLDNSWKDEWANLDEGWKDLWTKLDNSWKDEWDFLATDATKLWDKLDASWKDEWSFLSADADKLYEKLDASWSVEMGGLSDSLDAKFGPTVTQLGKTFEGLDAKIATTIAAPFEAIGGGLETSLEGFFGDGGTLIAKAGPSFTGLGDITGALNGFEFPEIKIPTISVKLPTLKAPKIKFPKFEWPAFPRISWPKLPELKVDVPKPSWLNSGGKVPGYNSGGAVSYLNDGGDLNLTRAIFQPKGQDTVPAMLTPGEYVIQRSSVDQIGEDALNFMNRFGRLPPQGPTNLNLQGGLGGGGEVNNNMTITIEPGAIVVEASEEKDGEDMADMIIETIKRRSLDGEFVISSQGVRET